MCIIINIIHSIISYLFYIDKYLLVMIIITLAVIAIEYFPTRWWVPLWEGRVVSLQGGETKNKMRVDNEADCDQAVVSWTLELFDH